MDSNNKINKLPIVFFILLVVGGVIYYLYTKNFNKPLTGTISTVHVSDLIKENPSPVGIDHVISVLYGVVGSAPSPIKSKNEVASSALSSDILSLINTSATSININSAEFNDSTNGYTIDYTFPSLILESQAFFSRVSAEKQVWKINKSINTNIGGVIKIEDEKFNGYVEERVIDPKNIGIHITLIQK